MTIGPVQNPGPPPTPEGISPVGAEKTAGPKTDQNSMPAGSSGQNLGNTPMPPPSGETG